VPHETIRQWGLKCGQEFANHRTVGERRAVATKGTVMSRRQQSPEEHGASGRAVDRAASVSIFSVQSRRDKKAAKRLFRKLLRTRFEPIVCSSPSMLRAYAAAKREIMPCGRARQRRASNNRAENSHQPTDDESGA